MNNNEEIKTEQKKTKKNPFLKFLSIILTVIVTLIVILAGILLFCALDRKSSLSSIPRNYSVYVHTDSAFDTINPLFDLQAADIFLSSPELSQIRKTFMDFRSSELRENPAVKFAASRPVDFALYGNGTKIGEDSHFVAIVNLGPFSLASRVASLMYPKINPSVENLSYETNEQTSYFVYDIPNSIKLYIKTVKNLVIVSDSFEHLVTACLTQNDSTYTAEQKALFKTEKKGELKIVADAHSLMGFITSGNDVLSSMASIIDANSLSTVSFSITDADISIDCKIPVNSSPEYAASLSPILSRKSTAPSILTRFSDITQYYTLVNAGSFEELKNSILPYLPDVKDPEEFWENCNGWSKTILSMDLEEFLFSWMGNEAAVFGIENQNDPVFAIQVKDEKARQNVFNKLTSSILVKEESSLILGGLRLPRLELPSFLNFMLSLVGVNIPSPYFIVLDGNIYFSESPECLSAVYNNANSGKALVKNKNYMAVSETQKNETSLSLFYNLERSIPFFLRSNQTAAQILKLYTMGRFDVITEKDLLKISLHACARKSGSLYAVPGFPMELEGKADISSLCTDSGKNPKYVYWTENGSNIKTLELSSMTIMSKEDSDKIQITAQEKTKNNSSLWSVSNHGIVSLLKQNLESMDNFPIMLGETISCRPCSVGENIVIISENENVYIISPDASMVTIQIPGLSPKSEITALGNGKSFIIYSKGFLGKIYYFEGDKCLNIEKPFEIPGIALGSPALLSSGGKTYIGLITQAGEMNVWTTDSTDGAQINNFPVKVGGVFMTNVVAARKYFYALSNDAMLHRISLDGTILNVQIPNSTAKEGYICARDPEHKGKENIFVCADANVIYGFNDNLELLSGYPLTGFGRPVFADANGDKTSECIALTIDKKIVAWKTR